MKKYQSIELQRDLPLEEKDLKLQQINRTTDVGYREMAFYLAEMDAKGEHQLLGYRSAMQYAVDRLELHPRTARHLCQVGRELEELHLIDEAFCKGELSWSRVRLLVRVAVPETEAGPVELSDEEAAEIPGAAPRVPLNKVPENEDAPATEAMRKLVFARRARDHRPARPISRG